LKHYRDNAKKIKAGYEKRLKPYGNKYNKHWYDILIDGSIQDECLIELIDHSYDLVKNKLTRKERACIESGDQE
jgi:predicted DNA-binding protein (MmcQ/YjbR family)